jgi:hypothetical protein
MWYHNQCISPGNVLYVTTTSASHLAMCHAVPRPVQPSNMSYGTTTRGTAWHIARWNTLVVVLYDILLGCTGRGTVRHITRWNTLVVVPYDTLPGERYWSWYHMTHWQVRGTGRGTVWHILTHDHVGNEYKISTNSETIFVFFLNWNIFLLLNTSPCFSLF